MLGYEFAAVCKDTKSVARMFFVESEALRFVERRKSVYNLECKRVDELDYRVLSNIKKIK